MGNTWTPSLTRVRLNILLQEEPRAKAIWRHLAQGNQAVRYLNTIDRAQNSPGQPPLRSPPPVADTWKVFGPRTLSRTQDSTGRTLLLPHVPYTTPRDILRKKRHADFFLFTKTLLSDMLDKKNYSHNQVMPK